MFYCFRVKFWNVRYLEEMDYDNQKAWYSSEECSQVQSQEAASDERR